MGNNDIILLNQLIEQKMAEVGEGLSESDFFEIFSAEQVLKDYDLSYEEIIDGIIGNSGDGGIDSVYLFINDSLYHEEEDLGSIKKNVKLKVTLIQSKTSQSFSEKAIESLISTMRDILDLSKPIDSLNSVYNRQLLDKMNTFRNTYMALTSRFPDLEFAFYYVTKGTDIHPNVERKAEILKDTVHGMFKPCKVSFNFVGAADLLVLARRSPSTAHQLRLAESPISTGQVGFIGLVNLKDFYNFITDDSGNIKKAIFEGNVRDYQGKTEVNEHIANTLVNPGTEDFWWLNNGVSIICTQATLSGKMLTIEDPEIVNGLQTSAEIYNFFSSNPEVVDQRNILIRVIVPEDDNSRDRIIKATNSQTPIPVASLRATDKIHRDIEEFLQIHGLFYDRRKNFYKNLGKPIKNIIGIPYMAQAVLACALLEPGNARARPSSLLKEDTTYLKIFNPEYPIELYLKCVKILRRVESFLKSEQCSFLEKADINNLRFYVCMLITLKLTQTLNHLPKKVSNIELSTITDELIKTCFETVYGIYKELGATDQVAKGREFTNKLLELHEEEMAQTLVGQEIQLNTEKQII